jgi:hypothetical protein
MGGSTNSAGALTSLQTLINGNEFLQDAVFILAIIGFLVAWKFLVEGLIE